MLENKRLPEVDASTSSRPLSSLMVSEMQSGLREVSMVCGGCRILIVSSIAPCAARVGISSAFIAREVVSMV